MHRTRWTDERLDDRMTAMDRNFDLLHDDLAGIRAEIRGLRDDFSSLQRHLVQIGFGLVGVLTAALVALILALV